MPATIPPIGKWLKQIRKSRDLTQRGLASMVGCSVRTLEKIETGDRRPSRQIAVLIAEALGIPPADHDSFVQFARGMSATYWSATASGSQWRGASGESSADDRDNDGTGDSASNSGRGGNGDSAVAGAGAAEQWAFSAEDTPPETSHAALPNPSSPLIDREETTAYLLRLLLDGPEQIVTLVGPPGIGKTRLAINAASQVLTRFQHGVYFVSLIPLANHDQVAAALGQALGLRVLPGEAGLRTVTGYLLHKNVLFVVDNFEHVVQAAPVLSRIAALCPDVKMLVTSRHALDLDGECEVLVTPLSVPSTDDLADVEQIGRSEAVQLFLSRAVATGRPFALNAKNAADVAEICRHLEGLPLAIELAAIRVRVLSPREILSRLRASSLALLTKGDRDADPRHQTLSGAMKWSYDLLDKRQRTFFRVVSVFECGFTVEMAEDLCGLGVAHGLQPLDVLQLIGALVERSLLQEDVRDRQDPEPARRFRMLRVAQEYAQAELAAHGEERAVRDAHAQLFLTWAEEARRHFTGPKQARWLAWLDRALADLTTAIKWLRKRGKIDLELRLCSALAIFWARKNHWAAGEAALASVLERSANQPVQPDLRIDALRGAAVVANTRGRHDCARELLGECLKIAASLPAYPPSELAYLTNLAGLNDSALGRYEEAGALHREALAIARQAGSKQGEAFAFFGLSLSAVRCGEVGDSRRLAEMSLDLYWAARNPGGASGALELLALAELLDRNWELARMRAGEGLSLCRELGDSRRAGIMLQMLGYAEAGLGNTRQAGMSFRRSLTALRGTPDGWALGGSVRGLASLALVAGDAERAAQLAGAAQSLANTEGGNTLLRRWLPLHPEPEGARDLLGEGQYEAQWSRGFSMSAEDAIDLACREETNAASS